MNSRPVVLLDIDGVCSPMCPADQLERAWAPWHRAQCGWNKGWVSPSLGLALTALSEHAEIWWCSGWEGEAPLYGNELGVSFWPHLPMLNVPDGGMFKLASVIAAVGSRPVWWWDDEHNEATQEWSAVRSAQGIPTICAPIDDQRGLRPEDLSDAEEWLCAPHQL